MSIAAPQWKRLEQKGIKKAVNMSNLNEYKNLVKDTLDFLKNSDVKNTVFISDFFKKDIDLGKKKPKVQKANPPQKKKYNIGFIQQPNQKPSLANNKPKEPIKVQPIEENKSTTKQPKDEKPIQRLEEKPQVLQKALPSKPTIDNKKIIIQDKPKIFEDSFSDIKKDFFKIFPQISLEAPLDDKIAKQKAQNYKLKNIAANITILAYKENEKFYKFLEKLSIALDVYFYPSKVVSAYLIEKENNWEAFLSRKEIFLIIAADHTIFELSNLRKYYKENPSLVEKYLNDIPLFLLPDISLYFKEPSLKSSLFKALEQKILKINNEK